MAFAVHLSRQQIRKLSDICADIAQVSLASLAIPFLLQTIDIYLGMFGVILALAFWILSLILIEYGQLRSSN